MRRPFQDIRPVGPFYQKAAVEAFDSPEDKSCVFAISSKYNYSGTGDITDDEAFNLLDSFENKVENQALINIENTNLIDMEGGMGLEASFISSISNMPLRQLNMLQESVTEATTPQFKHSETILETLIVDKNTLPTGAQMEGVNVVNCNIGFAYTTDETFSESEQQDVSMSALEPLTESLGDRVNRTGFTSREGKFVGKKSNVLVTVTDESQMTLSEVISLANDSKDKLDREWKSINNVSVIAK